MSTAEVYLHVHVQPSSRVLVFLPVTKPLEVFLYIYRCMSLSTLNSASHNDWK